MKVKNVVYGAIYLALGVVLPLVFHAIGLGAVFLPMHIPVILAGFHMGPLMGLVCGFFSPLLSHVLTGMPPVLPPTLPVMMVELPLYGFLGGLFYRKYKLNLWVSLIGAMLLGRIGMGLWIFILAKLFNIYLHPLIYLQGAVLTGIPGILLQLILIPPSVKILFRQRE